ncbi:hypothetical protein VIGAN_02307100, partial [Vigna angularis var. angularis]
NLDSNINFCEMCSERCSTLLDFPKQLCGELRVFQPNSALRFLEGTWHKHEGICCFCRLTGSENQECCYTTKKTYIKLFLDACDCVISFKYYIF